jgi:hypothetical protein
MHKAASAASDAAPIQIQIGSTATNAQITMAVRTQ